MSVRYVEGIRRWYQGKWVTVRGCQVQKLGEDIGLAVRGAVLGESRNGYGKLNNKEIDIYEQKEKEMLEIKEGGRWERKVVGDYKVGEKVNYREIDLEYALGIGKRMEGVSYASENEEVEELMLNYERVEVETREGFERLLECDYMLMQFDKGEDGGIYIDPKVSLKGVSANDFRCIGSEVVYISEKQAIEVDWGIIWGKKERLKEWGRVLAGYVMVYVDSKPRVAYGVGHGLVRYYLEG